MSNQNIKSDLLAELSTEDQQLLSGGQNRPYVCYFCSPLYGGYGGGYGGGAPYGGGYGGGVPYGGGGGVPYGGGFGSGMR